MHRDYHGFEFFDRMNRMVEMIFICDFIGAHLWLKIRLAWLPGCQIVQTPVRVFSVFRGLRAGVLSAVIGRAKGVSPSYDEASCCTGNSGSAGLVHPFSIRRRGTHQSGGAHPRTVAGGDQCHPVQHVERGRGGVGHADFPGDQSVERMHFQPAGAVEFDRDDCRRLSRT